MSLFMYMERYSAGIETKLMTHLFCLVVKTQMLLPNKETCHWRKHYSVWCIVYWRGLSQKEIQFKERETCAECGLFGHMALLGLARCSACQAKRD